MYKCQYCHKEFEKYRSLGSHVRSCKKNPNFAEIKQKQISSFKKNLTKERRLEISSYMKKAIKEHPESYSTHNIIGRVKNYKIMMNNKNVTNVKGTWELLFATYLNNNEIYWTNKIKPIPYCWKGKWHLYFPDFYLIDSNIYVEIKGFKTDRDLCKWAEIKNIIVLMKDEIDLLKENKFDINNYMREGRVTQPVS